MMNRVVAIKNLLVLMNIGTSLMYAHNLNLQAVSMPAHKGVS